MVGYCPERAAERNPSFLSALPAALLAAPPAAWLCLSKGTAAAGMELEKAANSHTVGARFPALSIMWSDIMGPVFDPVVLCMNCCPS